MPPKPVATRKRNGSITTPDEYQDIKNAAEGRKFLEKHSLLCPPGEPATNGAIAVCLHQISALAGLPKQALNAIRATAFMLEELEEEATNEIVRSAFDSQITEFTADMQLLVEDVNTKIDDHLKDALTQWKQALTEPMAHPSTEQSRPSQTATTTTHANRHSYASTLINPPAHVNPKLAAREGVRARQFVFDGAKEVGGERWDTKELKDAMNDELQKMGVKGGKIRSIVSQRDGGSLIEVDSDALAKWFADPLNSVEFCCALGEGVTFRSRTYNIIAFNAPINLDPSTATHREEINDVNQLGENTIKAIRWAKPINRRSPQQKTAHLILSFSDPEAANQAISIGVTICNKLCRAERVKKEPLRCMKCQGWNHMAKECIQKVDKCSNCAGDHKSDECRSRSTRCVSCRTDDHSSWSRECPVFLRKSEELSERHPEN